MKIDGRTLRSKRLLSGIRLSTHISRSRVSKTKSKAARMTVDVYRGERIEKCLCIACYYSEGGIAGQAFTEYECECCGGKFSHHNTKTPKFCSDCARDNNICRECGSELYLE